MLSSSTTARSGPHRSLSSPSTSVCNCRWSVNRCCGSDAWPTNCWGLRERCDVDILKRRLYDDYRVEAPVHRWRDQPFIRVSCAAYNTEAHIDALLSALGELLHTG